MCGYDLMIRGDLQTSQATELAECAGRYAGDGRAGQRAGGQGINARIIRSPSGSMKYCELAGMLSVS